MWNGMLLLGDFFVVYLGPGGPAGWHAHHAEQIALAPEGEVVVELEGGRVERGRSVVVPSGVRHRMEVAAERVAVVFVDRALARRGTAPAPPFSPGVLAALAYVDAELDARPTLTGAAAAANLSPSRLTHVFTREVGLPFKRYVAWRRLRRVVVEVAGGASLTRAAASAGFSDSAHLSRTFRRAFGLPPSALQGMRLLVG